MKIDPYIGQWHITQMDAWDKEFFNMDGQATIQIEEDGGGRFKFGAVQSEIDGAVSDKRFEFCFQGFDEGDSVSGRGWVTLKDTNTLKGEIRFFQGEKSGFDAEKG